MRMCCSLVIECFSPRGCGKQPHTFGQQTPQKAFSKLKFRVYIYESHQVVFNVKHPFVLSNTTNVYLIN